MRERRDEERMDRLIRSGPACVIMSSTEEPHVRSLLRDAVAGTLFPLWEWSATRGLCPGFGNEDRCIEGTENPAAALVALREHVRDRCIGVLYDVSPHLDDDHTLRALRETIHRFEACNATLILVDHQDTFPSIIQTESVPFPISLPDANDLEKIIRQAISRVNERHPVDARVKKKDLDTILRNLSGLTRRQAARIMTDVINDDFRLDAKDINHILAFKRQHLHHDGLLDYVEAPVSLDEIGGLHHLKHWLDQRRHAMSAKATEFGLSRPRGVLLLGVQGAGKSLSAKAIATAWKRPLLRLDPGVLYGKYIGESEHRLRQALEQAERMAPIVLWVDEIEKGFASAASQSTDGGLSQRMFGTFLTWMQENTEPVFLVATANNIEALPPELLRKGRFDEIFFVDLPDAATRAQIAGIHLKRRGRDATAFDLDAIAERAEGYSGAEIEQAVVSALHVAFAADRDIQTEDILTALRDSPPLSITMRERLTELREWARGRCVPAN